jgi:S-layer homology domain
MAVLVSVAITVPASVWAVTTFSDVPSNHTFHNEISAVAGAGIAQGFGDGTYRPANNVTRQAMAAFLERGVGRTAVGEGAAFLNQYMTSEVVAVALDAGATGVGTTGFVHISASAWVRTGLSTTAGCPCTVELRLLDGNTQVSGGYLQVPLRPDSTTSAGAAVGTATIETLVPIQGDQTHRYRLVAHGFAGGPPNTLQMQATISATYSPLSGDGDATAEYELACPKDDPWEQNDAIDSPAMYFIATPASAIACPSDQDWYETDHPGGDLTVTLDQFSHSEGNLDVCVYFFETLVNCSTGTGDLEVVSVPGGSAGFYQINVYLASDGGTFTGNTYRVTANF